MNFSEILKNLIPSGINDILTNFVKPAIVNAAKIAAHATVAGAVWAEQKGEAVLKAVNPLLAEIISLFIDSFVKEIDKAVHKNEGCSVELSDKLIQESQATSQAIKETTDKILANFVSGQ